MRRVNPKPRFYLIMFLVLAVVLGTSFAVAEGKLREGRARLAERTAERDALVNRVGELQSEIDFAQTDAYIERMARDELGLIMPDEIRYVSN